MTHSSTMLLHQWFECLLTHATIPKWLVRDKAYAMFGRGNVDRWRKQGKINPCKRPGKVEYRTVEITRPSTKTTRLFQNDNQIR